MTRRITAKSFIDAVRRTGTVPRRSLWIRERAPRGPDGEPVIEVCAIGALCVDAGRRDYMQFARDAEDGLGLSAQYIAGFIAGFDGRRQREHWDDLGESATGWEDGVACAVAAFEEKLHEEYRVVDAEDPTPWMNPSEDDEVPQYVTCVSWS